MGQKLPISENYLPENHSLAVLGHELGNVLHGLLGMAELLGESSLTSEQGRWLRAIEYSGRQMASLIRLTRSSEPSSESCITPRPHRVDGIELLECVVTSHTPAARTGKNQLVLLVDPDMPRYWYLDACLVRQILDNLVGNANKYTQAGQIVIEAAVDQATGCREGAIRLSVSDTGSGFESSVAEHLFGAYRRFSVPGEATTGNRGLGLYICNTIAQAMNGRLSCTCPEGGGAWFEVFLSGVSDEVPIQSPEFRSGLLDHLICRIELDGVLGQCVENFLIRLGVRFCDDEGDHAPVADQALEVIISENEEPDICQPCLLLTAMPDSGTRFWQKNLQSPVLESSLGGLLLEFALEWRSWLIRSGSRGSIPTPL